MGWSWRRNPYAVAMSASAVQGRQFSVQARCNSSGSGDTRIIGNGDDRLYADREIAVAATIAAPNPAYDFRLVETHRMPVYSPHPLQRVAAARGQIRTRRRVRVWVTEFPREMNKHRPLLDAGNDGIWGIAA
jgi:hypothetical protein